MFAEAGTLLKYPQGPFEVAGYRKAGWRGMKLYPLTMPYERPRAIPRPATSPALSPFEDTNDLSGLWDDIVEGVKDVGKGAVGFVRDVLTSRSLPAGSFPVATQVAGQGLDPMTAMQLANWARQSGYMLVTRGDTIYAVPIIPQMAPMPSPQGPIPAPRQPLVVWQQQPAPAGPGPYSREGTIQTRIVIPNPPSQVPASGPTIPPGQYQTMTTTPGGVAERPWPILEQIKGLKLQDVAIFGLVGLLGAALIKKI